jgi:NAD(P)-dependent dehydrogenase (short-subunit alcohol dehydrogenase family)
VPSVLITGASRGIGRVTAVKLAQDGWQVHATVRRGEDGEALRAQDARITPVQLDLTDTDAIAKLPEAVGGRLDAVVNNAGIVVPGPIEALAPDQLRHQLEVNVVAQVAVTQAVLPLLRSSRGRVVFISSISGRVASPLLGAYGASKFALEAIGDALRAELRPWGIKVILVEPGSVDTDIWRRADETAAEVEAELSPEHRRLYESQLQGVRRLSRQIQGRTMAPEKVADTVHAALSDDRPRARYLVGLDAYAQLLGSRTLPTPVWDAIVARVTGAR